MQQAAGFVNTAPPDAAAKVTPLLGSKLTSDRRMQVREEIE